MDTAKIAKLPKWAQEHIKDLQRQRDIAVRRLDEMTDSQTPSPFSDRKLDCTEDGAPVCRTVYYQARRMDVSHANVCMSICLRDDGINLSWCADGPYTMRELAMIPESFQKVRLVARDNMRS